MNRRIFAIVKICEFATGNRN